MSERLVGPVGPIYIDDPNRDRLQPNNFIKVFCLMYLTLKAPTRIKTRYGLVLFFFFYFKFFSLNRERNNFFIIIKELSFLRHVLTNGILKQSNLIHFHRLHL